MKKSIFSIALLLPFFLLGQPFKSPKAHLQKVVVYLQGAHLYYTENVNLLQGYNEITFENISSSIFENSLQAICKGGTVMEMRHAIKYIEKHKVVGIYDKSISQVLDSIEEANFQSKAIQNKLNALSLEKSLLLNNHLIKGEFKRDTLNLLKESLSYLRERLDNINDLLLISERSQNKNSKLLSKLNERYQLLLNLQSGETDENADESQPIHQVIVSVYAETANTTQLNFNYFISTASWVPTYDLQASSITNDFQLKYFANVSQESGLDWKNTALTLSTSNPNENNMIPTLVPWYLRLIEAYKANSISYGISANAMAPMQIEDDAKEEITNKKMLKMPMLAEAKPMTDYVALSENLIRTEYEIRLNYNINSDGKPHKVLINQKAVPMAMKFVAVPKICNEAFLVGKVTGWEDLNIIPGNARLNFDGAYIGEMVLNASSATDTLDVSLGRDKGIVINRKKIKEKCKVKFLDDQKVETRTMEILVRNTKGITIEMEITDQIPIVAGTEEIKVILKDGDGAELDEPTGTLKWKLKLGSKETKKLLFTYEIHYPKNKPVAGL